MHGFKGPDLSHSFGVNEVLIAPNAWVIVVLPLHVDVEVGEVVTLWDWKLLPHLVTLFFTTLLGHGGHRYTEKVKTMYVTVV